MSAWIDLERFLVPFDASEEELSLAGLPFKPANALTWTQVLPGPCVVVLGEGGIGKTSELRGQAQRLRDEGREAFFVPIEALAKDGLAMSIEEEPRAFEEWKHGQAEAWFFLDSVDEAKLVGESLQRALKQLVKELSGKLNQCHIVVSCRPSDWKKSDEDELRRLEGRLVKPSEPVSLSESRRGRRKRQAWSAHETDDIIPLVAMRVLRLAPLTREQIKNYAGQKEKLTDADAFVEAIGIADLWGLAARPLDVEWLAGSWKRKRGFAPLRIMIEENIHEKLGEVGRDPGLYPSPISRERARKGVEHIALVLTMVGRSMVAVPNTATGGSRECVDVRKILANWTDPEILALLRLAIFDPATYGRVRFHHRMVREYLAASCLLNLRECNLTELQLDRLLFVSVERSDKYRPEFAFSRPGFEAVVAWAALRDKEVLARAVDVAPEYLVNFGDPSGLLSDTRHQILHSYVRRFEGRKRTLHDFDPAGLLRFVGEDIATTVKTMLMPGTSNDLRRALLRVVERKRLGWLAEAALRIAIEEPVPFIRNQAIGAVVAAGTLDQKRALLQEALSWLVIDRDAAYELLKLFPEVINNEQVIVILKSVDCPRGYIDGYHHALEELVTVCPDEQKADLLAKLISLFECLEAEKGKDVGRFLEWAPAVVLLLEDVLRGERMVPDLSVCLRLLEVAAKVDAYIDIELRQLIEGKALLRRALFWHIAEQNRNSNGRWARSAGRIWPHKWFSGTEKDAGWLEIDARTHAEIGGRLLAFDSLMDVLDVLEPDGGDLCRVQRITAECPELDRHFRRKLQPHLWSREDLAANCRMSWRARWEERKRENRRRENREALQSKLTLVRGGDAFELLLHLYVVGHQGGGKNWSRDAIVAEYGQESVDAVVEGFQNYWDKHAPLRPQGEDDVEQPRYAWEMGALGLELTVQAGSEVAQFSDDRLKKAITYACWGNGRLPLWLEMCAKDKPMLILEVFAPVLRAEYGGKAYGRLFAKLVSASEIVRAVCAPFIVQLLAEGDPVRDQVLTAALQVVRELDPLGADLRPMCRARCLAHVGKPELFALWWRTWLSQDAPAAAIFLREYVSEHCSPNVADACVAACVPERQSDDLLATLRGSIDGLLALLDVVLKHIRPAEDTAEIHGRRRDAQEFRWRTLSVVIETGDPAALRKLDSLAAMSWDSEWWTDLLKHAADGCAINGGALRWSLDDALHFLDQGLLVPQMSGELFTVVVDVVEDVRRHIEFGDGSPRAAYDRDEQDEVQFQILMLGYLEQRAKGRYSVVRESELADATRPDLRVYSNGLGPVSVEIKVVEKGWSLQGLEDAIEKQLVGQYMKDAAARYGVLILMSAGKPRERWEKAGIVIASFSALVEHLRGVAADVRRRLPQVEGLAVVGIDFHETSGSKALPKRTKPGTPRKKKK